MTNAENITIIAGEGAGLVALTEERFGPLPQREPGVAGQRARHIAAIHALADFLSDHPDVPVPYLTRVHCKMQHTLAVDQLADHLGLTTWRNAHGITQHLRIVVGDGRDQDAEILIGVQPDSERPL